MDLLQISMFIYCDLCFRPDSSFCYYCYKHRRNMGGGGWGAIAVLQIWTGGDVPSKNNALLELNVLWDPSSPSRCVKNSRNKSSKARIYKICSYILVIHRMKHVRKHVRMQACYTVSGVIKSCAPHSYNSTYKFCITCIAMYSSSTNVL